MPQREDPVWGKGYTGWRLNPSALTTSSEDLGPDTVGRATGGGRGECPHHLKSCSWLHQALDSKALTTPPPGGWHLLPETQRHALAQRGEGAGHGPHTGVPNPPRPLSLSPGCGRIPGVLSHRPPTSLR